MKYDEEDFEKHWISTQSKGEKKGIAMFFEPTQKILSECYGRGKRKAFISFPFGVYFGISEIFLPNISRFASRLCPPANYAISHTRDCGLRYSE